MKLVYPKVDHLPKLNDEVDVNCKKITWLFPDISKSFPKIVGKFGEVIIDPFEYYITSGEAIAKTKVLISDVEELLLKHNGKLRYQLENLLIDLNEFLELLCDIKQDSLYLEVTKCEDGLYNGNICARKDLKKKKKKD